MPSSRAGPRHVVLVMLFFAAAVAARGADAASPVTTRPCGAAAAASFLCSRCATTVYPAVCYDSLLPYAGAFQDSRVRLARAAADVAAARLRDFSASLDELVHGSGDVGAVTTPPRVAAAVRDCVGTVSSAAGLARRSSAALGRLDAGAAAGGGGSRLARWEVSNAKTWLSAAMANVATCADGFADADSGSAAGIEEVVAGEAANVSKYTSNALALVNGIPFSGLDLAATSTGKTGSAATSTGKAGSATAMTGMAGSAATSMGEARAVAAMTEPTAASSATAFLRSRCATTRYPDVCYDSLLPYASTFQTSHVKLAVAAANVAAAKLRAFSARINDLLAQGGAARVDAALKDCKSTISDAGDLARQSSAELGQLDAGAAAAGVSSRQARWHVSNVQTWLSAAITDEGTCTDGFEEAGEAAAGSPAGKEVAAGVARVKQHTSIALALVNGIPL
uniref:pectinesterase n=1 Tax=Oryza nivara TaxID=4536 RepID=A0A0E0IQ84_ORYNI